MQLTSFAICIMVGLSIAEPTADSKTIKDLPDLGAPDYHCPGVMARSRAIPNNVHSVRPADINVIAALGDSITAGNGAGAYNSPEVFLEYRGLAFQIGGDKGLDQHITIPNILKTYNEDLFGASHGTHTQLEYDYSKLNVAIPGATSSLMLFQAKDLVLRMQLHSEVNMETDWKLVNIFIGGNDMCDVCLTGQSAETYAKNIAEAIEYLFENVPRTIVSLTGMFHLEMLRQVDSHQFFCQGLHLFECGCEWNGGFTDAVIASIVTKYQNAQLDLQNSGVFDKRSDFTLVVQPFLRNTTNPPRTADGKVDLTYFAPDCFHFSQLGHAVTAKYLWNNLLQPLAAKHQHVNLSDSSVPLACPSPECPFIRTTKNSEDCQRYLTPSVDDSSPSVSAFLQQPKRTKRLSSRSGSETVKQSGSGEGSSEELAVSVVGGTITGLVAVALLLTVALLLFATLLYRSKERLITRTHADVVVVI